MRAAYTPTIAAVQQHLLETRCIVLNCNQSYMLERK
jgi:hypothetical protein